jgi:hypothetical protein
MAEASDPIAAMTESGVLVDAHRPEGGVGFLLPDGRFLAFVENISHSDFAGAFGFSLSGFLHLGIARIYSVPGDFLGIEIQQPPTTAQKQTLVDLARFDVKRFRVEGFVEINLEAGRGYLTPRAVALALERARARSRTMG